MPQHDPFDHSKCEHPQPSFPVQLSDELTVDLVNVLHVLWLAIISGDIPGALDFIDDLGRWVEMASLGYGEDVDREVGNARDTARDIRTLRNNDEFEADLRRLTGEDK